MNAATEHVRAGLELERLTTAAQHEETARSLAGDRRPAGRRDPNEAPAPRPKRPRPTPRPRWRRTAELAAAGREHRQPDPPSGSASPANCRKNSCSAWPTRRTSACMRPRWSLQGRSRRGRGPRPRAAAGIEAAKAKIAANELKLLRWSDPRRQPAEDCRRGGDHPQANAARMEKEAAMSR